MTPSLVPLVLVGGADGMACADGACAVPTAFRLTAPGRTPAPGAGPDDVVDDAMVDDARGNVLGQRDGGAAAAAGA